MDESLGQTDWRVLFGREGEPNQVVDDRGIEVGVPRVQPVVPTEVIVESVAGGWGGQGIWECVPIRKGPGEWIPG